MINSNKMSIPMGIHPPKKEKFLVIAPPGWQHQMLFTSFVSRKKKILIDY